MKQFIISLCMVSTAMLLQAQSITDSTIAVVAYWQQGDSVNYKFKYTDIKSSPKKSYNKVSTYDVGMTILHESTSSYDVRWNYGNHDFQYELDTMEQYLMDICKDIPIYYRTNELGALDRITNWKEMQTVALSALDTWVEEVPGVPDSLKSNISHAVSMLFANEQQIQFFSKDLTFFHFLYGVSLYRDEVYEGPHYYMNPFMKKQMEGRIKIEVMSVDETQQVVTIKVDAGIDGEASKKLLFDYLQQNFKALGFASPDDIKLTDMPELSIKEHKLYTIDLATGYILQGYYEKRVDDDSGFRELRYDFELVR